MVSLEYKYYVALIEKFQSICQKAESKGGDWMDNFMDFFEDAQCYHFSCEISDRKTLCVRYSTSKNKNNLVSFTIWKENGKFSCNSAIGFPMEYPEDKRDDLMYDISRDCLDDLERLEKSS